MTKRQKRTRIRSLQKELITRMQEQYPLVELASVDELPGGTVVFDVYVPYEDTIAVLETVIDRVVELTCDEGFPVSIIPVGRKPTAKQRAA